MTLRQLYDELEDDNQHGLNAVLVAVACGDHQAVIRAAEILKAHLEIGHLPSDLGTERYDISQPCYKALRDDGKL